MNQIIFGVSEWLFCFLDIYFLYLFLGYFLEKYEDNKRWITNLIFVLYGTVTYGLTYINIYSIPNTIFSIVLMIFVSIFIFNSTIKSKILFTLFYMILFVIIITPTYLLLSKYFNLLDESNIRLIYNSIFYSIFLLVIRLLGKFGFRSGENTPNKYFIFVISFFSISLLVIFFIADTVESLSHKEEFYSILGVISVMLLGCNIGVYLFFQKISGYFSNRELSKLVQLQQEAVNRHIIEIDSTTKGIKDHFFILNKLSKDEDLKTIRRYLDNLTEEVDIITGIKIIDALFNQKKYVAARYHIDFRVNAFIRDPMNIKESDICALLSNISDISIKSGMKTRTFNRKIYLTLQPFKDYLMIILKNNTIKEEVEMKEDEIIWMSINSIVQKYKGNISFSYSESMFETKIFLLNKI